LSKDHIIAIPISNIPNINDETKLHKIILDALYDSSISVLKKDIFVIAHSIVSKSEGRIVHKDDVEVSERAMNIALRNKFDPIQVELALKESSIVIRDEGVLITEMPNGMVSNFSGVDKSNAPKDCYLLLPKDPDRSAQLLREQLIAEIGMDLAVIITDTQGRPWRKGSVNLAIGCAGINAFKFNKGKQDLYGRKLQQSAVCQIDEIASFAEPLMGQADEGVPVVIVRGYYYLNGSDLARNVFRPRDEDMFR
jgi:coenzyme F420-0:L-glutamate ligase/coenzyme F420-1:gamma-L-glutamate ligase